MKTILARMLPAILALCHISCLLPVLQTFPKTLIKCVVLDSETNRPVGHASVFLAYDGPSGQFHEMGPYTTDEEGLAIVSPPRKAFWMSGPEAYFTAGFQRQLRVSAYGYESYFMSENLDFGMYERKSPLTIKIRPYLNHFGGGIIKSLRREEDYYRIILQMVDGPETGTFFSIRIMQPRHYNIYIGKKLYLRKSIKEIEAKTKKHSIIAHHADEILREGFPEEPYIQKPE